MLGTLGIIGLSFIFGMLFAIYMDEKYTVRPLQDEAVKRGLGEWKITTKETERVFRWKKIES